jgi:YD repeat-containing protein
VGYGTASAALWSYGYTPETDLQAPVADPNGGMTTRSLDSRGDVTSLTDALVNMTSWTYNGFGEQPSETVTDRILALDHLVMALG